MKSKMCLCQEYVREGKLLTKKPISHPITQEMVLKTIETCGIMTGNWTVKYRLVYRVGKLVFYLVRKDRCNTYVSSKWCATRVKEEALFMTKEETEEFVRSNPRFLVARVTFEEVEDEGRIDCQVKEP